MARPKGTLVTAALDFEIDGTRVQVFNKGGDVYLKTNDDEEIIMRPQVAIMLGIGLQQIAQPEDD